MNPLARLGLMVEVIVLFGPAFMALLLSPIVVALTITEFHTPPYVPIVVALIGIAGSYGCFVLFRLLRHTFNRNNDAPAGSQLLLGFALGSAACVGYMFFARFSEPVVVGTVAPIVGGLHLMWINRKLMLGT